jgi:hypothetical protein
MKTKLDSVNSEISGNDNTNTLDAQTVAFYNKIEQILN